ncbi:MAG: Tad domain-containing protein [Bdellovibrionales bacterium]|nr:Tad domain-containing protein [Bdellovibrionales bacterium]
MTPIKIRFKMFALEERGQVIPMLALLLGIFAGIAAFVVNTNYVRVGEIELQAAVDAAAHSGATNLCGTYACWEAAKLAATGTADYHVVSMVVPDMLDELYEYNPVARKAGGESNGAGDLPPPNEIDEDTYEFLDMIITVQRGRWLVRDDDFDGHNEYRGFQSLEAHDAAMNNEATRGIPPILSANAVRVVIERTRKPLIGSVFGGVDHVDKAEAIAIVERPIDAVCAVPFAVPACAIRNSENGGLDQGLCEGDRLFTRADQFCTGQNCRNNSVAAENRPLPTFPSEACRPDGAYSHTDVAMYESAQEANQAMGGLVRFDALVDDENPVCVTQHGQPMSEVALEQKTRWGFHAKKYPSSIEHFGVVGLPSREVRFGTVLDKVESIFNDPLHAGCVPMRLGEEFQLLNEGMTGERFDSNIVWDKISNPALGEQSRVRLRDTELGSIEHSANIFRVQAATPFDLDDNFFKTHGVCPSRWVEPDSENVIAAQGPGGTMVTVPFKPRSGISDDTRVWKAKFPVIAATNIDESGLCASGNELRHLDADARIEIIGFVDGYVTDVSIGEQSQSAQEAGIPEGSGIAWGFSVPNQTTECNSVRAKLSCGTNFIAGDVPPGANPPASIVKLPCEWGG